MRPASQEVAGTAQRASGAIAGGSIVAPSIVTRPRKPTESDPGGVRPQGTFNHAERMRQFNELKAHNFRVVSRVEQEVQTRWIEDLGQQIRVTIAKRRASHIAASIRGTIVNDSGTSVPHRFGHTSELPFTTFDNPWITDDFTSKDVARMLWLMPAFGNSFIMIPMSEKEVEAYWEQKTSPQVREAQSRMLDEAFTDETIGMQEELLAIPSAAYDNPSLMAQFNLPPQPA